MACLYIVRTKDGGPQIKSTTLQRREGEASTKLILRVLYKLKTSERSLDGFYHYHYTVSQKDEISMQLNKHAIVDEGYPPNNSNSGVPQHNMSSE
jgi:hypothetical protein